MIRFSSRAEKISLISLFSVMLAVIVGLSIALDIISTKSKENLYLHHLLGNDDWDVITDEYAYQVRFISTQASSVGNNVDFEYYVKVANLTDKLCSYSYRGVVYDKSNPILEGDRNLMNGVNSAYSSVAPYSIYTDYRVHMVNSNGTPPELKEYYSKCDSFHTTYFTFEEKTFDS